MSRPATIGSVASAVTGVKDSPSAARTSSSAARSRATPTTRAPAALRAVAMPRPKPRLAPVTSAVAPARSLSDITILQDPGGLPAPFVTRSADIDQPDPEQSPRAGLRIRMPGSAGAVLPRQAERPEQARVEEGDDPRDPRRGDRGRRHRVEAVCLIAFALVD